MKKPLIGFLTLSLALTGFASPIKAEEKRSYHSDSVIEFVPSSEPSPPVDPEKPDPEKPVQPIDPTDPNGPEPGTQGPLSIDYVSSLDFGKNRISNQDQVYYARAQMYQSGQKETPNFVQITDNRGTSNGWTLLVKQKDQLKAVDATQKDVLIGAQITLAAPTVTSNTTSQAKPTATNPISLIPGIAAVVLSAKVGSGSGLWVTYWGSVEEVEEQKETGDSERVKVTKDIALSVPGVTPKSAVKYQTNLLWTLTDVPQN